MMNTWRIRLATVSLAILCFFLPATGLAADYHLNRFDEVIQVNTDGSFDVTETILADFSEPKHGLYRVIPTHYRADDGSMTQIVIDNVTVTDLGGNALETLASNEDAFSLRIGSADATVYGPQYYVIHYRVTGALVDLADRTELYWSVTGTEWEIPPSEVSVHLRLPTDAVYTKEELLLACYTGTSGSGASDCTTAVAGKDLLAGTSNNFLTIAFAWPKGIVEVSAPIVYNYPPLIDLVSTSIWEWLFWLLPLLAFGFMFWRWHKHGRDPKGRGTIVPEYEPPKNMRAAEVGMLWASRMVDRYLSAAIVELAVRGHLKIIEVVQERIGFDRKTFSLERLAGGEPLRDWEKQLLAALFKDGRTLTTEDDLKNKFSKDKGGAIIGLESWLVSEGYFAANPTRVRTGWMTFGIVCLFIGFWGMFWPVLVTGGIVCLFGWLMPKRTAKGAEAVDVAKGFKLFLNTAEKYRLEWQEKEGIFEKYLSYAMVFGVADKWAKAFAAVHIQQVNPGWYVGASLMNFNAVDFTSRMNALTHQMTTVAAPKSGASGGGGFSGGGFGGGGGGSW